jgi:hypothetical protein
MLRRLLPVVIFAFSAVAFGQSYTQGGIAPIATSGLDNQLFAGYEHMTLDYALKTGTGQQRLTASGVNLQYAYRQRDHVMFVGSGRYLKGNPLGITLAGATGGAGYVLDWKRYQAFALGQAGFTRLSASSPDGIYLSTSAQTGFTASVGVGVDINIGDRYGIRPLYFEDQFLPFGSNRSVYWSLSSGILVRFRGPFQRRH